VLRALSVGETREGFGVGYARFTAGDLLAGPRLEMSTVESTHVVLLTARIGSSALAHAAVNEGVPTAFYRRNGGIASGSTNALDGDRQRATHPPCLHKQRKRLVSRRYKAVWTSLGKAVRQTSAGAAAEVIDRRPLKAYLLPDMRRGYRLTTAAGGWDGAWRVATRWKRWRYLGAGHV